MKSEAGAEAREGNVHGLAEHAGFHQLQHLLIRGAVVMRKADHDLRVIFLGHGLDFARILQRRGDGLFQIERDVVLENHLHIVQPLRGRRGDHDIVGLRGVVLDLLVGDGWAAEFSRVDGERLLAHVIDAGDLAAEADDGSAMVAGDIAAADHEYVHSNLLFSQPMSALACSTMFSTVTPLMASRRSYGADWPN